MIPPFLSLLKEEIIEYRLIKSGHVADVWKAYLDSGVYCIKHYKDRDAVLRRQAELNDLQLISKAIPEAVPGIHEELISGSEHIVLCLDWIDKTSPVPANTNSVAQTIFELHQEKSELTGLHYCNYIGELTQDNQQTPHWPAFWTESRLLPQLKLVRNKDLIQSHELRLLETYISKLDQYLPEPPFFSLLHGDLWNGNVLSGKNGNTFLIDPAVYFGDPWVDLAMTKLFGGFDSQFYAEYFDLSQIDRKAEELIPHYQLYYLMVHLNMFGRSYYPDIAGIVKRFL